MKIVGNGLLASVFGKENFGSKITIFASGVSNSREIDNDQFKREKILLEKHLIQGQTLVYFSTCSILDPSSNLSPYVRHKLQMEKLVLNDSCNIVIRLPQVVGRTKNRNTLINYLANRILLNEHYTLQKRVIRTLIDIDDVQRLTKYVLEECAFGVNYNFTIPISYEVNEIVSCLERIFNKKSNHTEVEGKVFHYPVSETVINAINKKIINISNNYLKDVLEKYYLDYGK